jgi:predicted metal-dependent peptidase
MSFSNLAKLAAARLVAAKMTPYFSSAMRKLVPVCVPDGTLPSVKGTLAVTDGMILLYEERALALWNPKELASVLVHEINHVIRRHNTRRGARNPKVWNQAVDAEINDDLVQVAGICLPGDYVMPKNLPGGPYPDGQIAEQYYDLVMAHLQSQGIDPNSLGGQCGGGQCGGCAGNPGPVEGNYGSGDPADENSEARTQEEIQNTIDQTARDIIQHQRTRGHVPGGLAKWAGDRLKPSEVPWTVRLARACRRALERKMGAVDTSYHRTSRRQAGVGFGPGRPILPTYSAPVPNIAIGVDTSSSMFGPELDTACTEIDAVLKAVGASALFIACDAKVHSKERVRTLAEARELLKGGGGTDFRPVFEALKHERNRPEVLIFITDGYGPAPIHPGPFHVIWVIVHSNTRPWALGSGVEDEGHGLPVTYGEFIFVAPPERSDEDDDE